METSEENYQLNAPKNRFLVVMIASSTKTLRYFATDGMAVHLATGRLHLRSILESEVQALVTILLSLHLIRLVSDTLSGGHSIPSLRLFPVEPTEVLPLGNEDHK